MYRRSLKAYCDTIDQHIAQIRSIQKTHHVDHSFVILQNRACVVLEICESYDNTFVADPRIPLDRVRISVKSATRPLQIVHRLGAIRPPPVTRSGQHRA